MTNRAGREDGVVRSIEPEDAGGVVFTRSGPARLYEVRVPGIRWCPCGAMLYKDSEFCHSCMEPV